MVTPHKEHFRSQFGEDKILAEHFGYKTEGCCVEIGAYDGVDCSNSYYFEHSGWQCVLVEAIPQLAELARVNGPRSQVFQCAVVAPEATGSIDFVVADDIMTLSSISLDSHNEKQLQHSFGRINTRSINVPARTIDDVLYESGVTNIDFITIDVEGHEYDALRGFDIDHWKPSLLILERNQPSPDWRIIKHLFKSGYVLFKNTGVNDWYRPTAQKPMATLAYGGSLIYPLYIKRLLRYLRRKFTN